MGRVHERAPVCAAGAGGGAVRFDFYSDRGIPHPIIIPLMLNPGGLGKVSS